MHNAASDVEKDGRKGTSSVSKVEKQDTQLRVTSTSTSDLVPQQQDPISTNVTLSTNAQMVLQCQISLPTRDQQYWLHYEINAIEHDQTQHEVNI